MSFAGANVRMPRVSLTALRTGETVEMPWVPTELTEKIVANYARKPILGMSHETLQYRGTGNYTLPGLEFFFQAQNRDQMDRYHDIRRYLMSLEYPPEGAQTVREGGPSRVLFFWPRMISVTCILTNLRFNHRQFVVTGESRVFTAGFDLEEIRDTRLTAERVRRNGPQRSAIPPEEIDDASA